jgi:putative peptide zinc metalloprotease protein
MVGKIHVAEGDSVRRGQLVMELENRELSSRLRQLQLSRNQNAIRMRQAAGRHDAAMQQVLGEKHASLAEQIQQLQRQAAGLRITAPRDGRVVARGLAARLGTYVHEGEPLMHVASEADKEVVALVGQQFISQARRLAGQVIPIRTAGFRALTGSVRRVEPRADDRLQERSLAASEGGPLAVRPGDEESDQPELRLTEPYFRTRIALADSVARHLPSGMRVQAWLGFRRQPLASRARQWVRRLWHEASAGQRDR